MTLVSSGYADVRRSWQPLRPQDAGPSRLGINADAGATKILSACGAFEWATFFYLTLINTLLIAFHKNLRSRSLHSLSSERRYRNHCSRLCRGAMAECVAAISSPLVSIAAIHLFF